MVKVSMNCLPDTEVGEKHQGIAILKSATRRGSHCIRTSALHPVTSGLGASPRAEQQETLTISPRRGSCAYLRQAVPDSVFT